MAELEPVTLYNRGESFTTEPQNQLAEAGVKCFTDANYLHNTFQSAYHPGHSTETALLKVVNDLFLSLNKGNISVLSLPDFSSVFDTIDHSILVHHLYTDIPLTNTALIWFSSYQTDHTHYISLSNHYSALAPVHSGVPQVSAQYFQPCH